REAYEPFLGPRQQPTGWRQVDGFTLHRLAHGEEWHGVYLRRLHRTLSHLRPQVVQCFTLASVSTAQVLMPEARELIERALQLAPEDSFIIDSMGWVLYRMGNLKDSLGYLRRAFAGRPDPEIAAHLGEVLWAMGARAEAERVWGDATRESPDNETLANTIKR